MLSVSFLHRRMISPIFCSFHKCNFHKLCISRLSHPIIFMQRIGPCVRAPHVCNLTNVRHMAGHAKWQNVKHVKAEKDRQKNIAGNKYAYLLRLAVREGGRDPKLNHKLSSIIEQAKKNNISMNIVENALKVDENKKTKYGSMELLGPGGCIIILEYETDNVSVIRHDVKVACKKSGAHVLSGEGRWRAVYEQKGIIKAVGRKDKQALNADKALDDAILAGAEEFLTKEDEDNKTYFEFLCSADDLHSVKKEIESNYEVEEAYVGYLPITRLQISNADMSALDILLEDLGNLPDIVRIYENVQ